MFSKDKVQSLTECMRQMILLLMMDGFLNPAMLCLEMNNTVNVQVQRLK